MLCFLYMQDEKKMSFKLFSKQFPSEIHSYRPPLPIQYLGFPFYISHSGRWACSGCYSIWCSLCPSSATLASVNGCLQTVIFPHKLNFEKWFQCSLCKCGHKTGQFQVGVGDMAKISYQFLFFRHFTILSQFFVMLVLPVCLSSTAKLISLL